MTAMTRSIDSLPLLSLLLITLLFIKSSLAACTVCQDGVAVGLPEVTIAIPGFPGEYTCAQLDLFLPTLLPDGKSTTCQTLQSVGSICGCPMPPDSCSLCDSIAYPQRELAFLADLFGGFVPTCELLDAYLQSQPLDNSLCTAGRQYLQDYCGCNGPQVGASSLPCSVCADGSNVTLPDQQILGLEPFTTCRQVDQAVSALFSSDSDECSVFQSISSLCGCPAIKENVCEMCPGGALAYPDKPVEFVMDQFGGIVPTCQLLDAYVTSTFENGSQECDLIQLASGYCGCPPISENHCLLCDDPLKPEYEQHVIDERFYPYLGLDGDIDFSITCELAISMQFQLEKGSTECTAGRSRRDLCGCNDDGWDYLKANTTKKKELLAWLPRISGFLSLIGASIIIIHVVKDKKNRRQMYNQLVATMSVFDLLGSIGESY